MKDDKIITYATKDGAMTLKSAVMCRIDQVRELDKTSKNPNGTHRRLTQ